MAVQGVSEALGGLEIATGDKTPDYAKLIEYGLDSKVADKLDEIYKVNIVVSKRNQRRNFVFIDIQIDSFVPHLFSL